MDEKQKADSIAQAENIEAMREFFEEWWTVEMLYEAEAKAALALLHLTSLPQRVLCEDEIEAIKDALNQHQMMVERMKPFAPKTENNE